MLQKPALYGTSNAEAFQDAGVVAAYHHRPPYPDETFDILTGLIAEEPSRVLDVGCGSGEIARPLGADIK